MPRADRKKVRKTYKKRVKATERKFEAKKKERERDRENEDIPAVSCERVSG